jgi:hypothetical protein
MLYGPMYSLVGDHGGRTELRSGPWRSKNSTATHHFSYPRPIPFLTSNIESERSDRVTSQSPEFSQ